MKTNQNGVVLSAKAEALWRFCNFQHARLSTTKTTVRINFDETSVCLMQTEKTGWVVPEIRKRMRQGESITGDVKTGAMRTNFSHLAFICDDASINEILPQILIFKESLMPMNILEAVMAAVPQHWLVLCQAKAWCNIAAMRKALVCLKKNLADWQATHQFVIMFDTFRSHINADIMKEMGESGLLVVVIPAKMTSMLQPLDVYAFAAYKRSLRLKSMLRRMRFPLEVNSWRRIVSLLVSTTIEVLVGKDWGPAFRRLGLTGSQVTVSQNTRSRLQITDLTVTLPNHVPTLAELEELFPARTVIPLNELFHVYPAPEPYEEPDEEPVAEEVMEASPVPGPWFGRTRSTSHLLVAATPEPSGFKPSSSATSSTSPWPLKMEGKAPKKN